MKDKLISLDALRKEVERNFDMQNLYLPVHILDVAEDVEEGIVRCKDCIYWQDNNNGYPHIGCKWMEDETPDPDDFCSSGERMVKLE